MGVMAMKGYSASPKLQYYCNLTIRLFSVISGTLFGGVLPLCRDAVNIFYSPSRLSQGKERNNDFSIYIYIYVYVCVCVWREDWLWLEFLGLKGLLIPLSIKYRELYWDIYFQYYGVPSGTYCCVPFIHRTSPGGNTPQNSSYTATYHPSRKLSKLDGPDMQDTAGEVRTSS